MDNEGYQREEAEDVPNKDKQLMEFAEGGSLQDYGEHKSLMQKFREYPKCVFFIFGNEFCERFSYYGAQTVLTIYFLNILDFSQNQATVLYNGWAAVCYFTPIFGCILADGYIGKFYTILFVSLLYASGNIILAVAATFPKGHSAHPGMDIAGLMIIALGTGGIKPCVAAFGGDQFRKGQERWLETFFSVFYFSINAGGCISTFLTPILRTQHCQGVDSCFPLAFGVPAALMVISCMFFIFGSYWYLKIPPKENVLGKSAIVTGKAIGNLGKGKREHWLQHYLDTHDCSKDPLCQEMGSCEKKVFVTDLSAVYRLLIMYLPMPFFWALYNQQGSKWIIQGTQMNGRAGSINILPDQVQVVNPILIMAFIPLFSAIIYPVVNKCYKLSPLRKMSAGGILAAVSYVVTGFVQLAVNKTLPVIPAHGTARMSFLNYAPCDVIVNASLVGNNTGVVHNFLTRTIKQGYDANYVYNATLPDAVDDTWYLDIGLTENGTTGCQLPRFGLGLFNKTSLDESVSIDSRGAYYVPITSTGMGLFKEPLQKPENGEGENIFKVNFMVSGYKDYDSEMFLCKPRASANISETKHGCGSSKKSDTFLRVNTTSFNATDGLVMKPGRWFVYLPDADGVVPSGISGYPGHASFNFTNDTSIQGSIMAMTISGKSTESDNFDIYFHTFTAANKVSIFWQLPQYLIVTAAEILFSITGLEFSYSQAPMSMKSVLQAVWLVSTAVGNVIIIIIVEAKIFENQAYVFFLFAGIMLFVMIIFMLLSQFYYKYVFYMQGDNADKEFDEKDNLKKE